MRKFFHATLLGALGVAGAAQAQSPVLEQASEYRFQLDLHVNDAALAKMLPAGWEPSVAATGPAKDCNVRLIFIDQINITGPDGKVLGKGSNRLAYLAVPVKQAGGTATGQMIIGGISENDAQPDGFGVYLKATATTASRTTSATAGLVQVTEDWTFTAAGGEQLQMHVKYARGAAGKGGGETKFYNPADPAQIQVFKTEQATDITRNVTTNPPDRVTEFSYKAGGGKFAALFDGSEKALSWDSQPVYARSVSAP